MKKFFLVLALIELGCSHPVQDADSLVHEGDMIFSSSLKKSLHKPSKLRNGLKSPLYSWPDGIVYFQFSPEIRKLFTKNIENC